MPATHSRLGRALVVLVVGAGLWVVVVSLMAALLSGLGLWHPWIGVPVAVVVALLAFATLARGQRSPSLPTAPALALLAVVVGFAAWAGATHAEQLLPRRDSASNLQAAISLASTHQRVVPVDVAALGGAAAALDLPGLTAASPAFYEVGSGASTAVQPQFVIGPAALHSLGVWLGGIPLALVLPAVAGALGILAIGLLAGRMIGPWWGVGAAALCGLSFPLLHVSRSTYSEPWSLVTLGAGLLALHEAAVADDDDEGQSAGWALLAGGLIGGTTFVRIDGLRETILLLVVAGLVLVTGRRWPRALLAGAGGVTFLALTVALWLSNQYLGSIARSLLPLVALGVGVALATWIGLRLARRGFSLKRYAVRAPLVVAVAVGVGLVFLAARPLFMTVRQDPNDPGARYVAGMQARQGLAVDGGRTYAEDTVTWLGWWLGPVALVLAATALLVLVHRALRSWLGADNRVPSWGGPLVVALGSTLMTLWRPGITPDHPWAERRLVVAIPFVLVLAVAALAQLARPTQLSVPTHVSNRGVDLGRFEGAQSDPNRPLDWLGGAGVRRTLAGVCALGVAVPIGMATWPHLMTRVEQGELAAVETVCAALQPGDVVLAVDSRAANEWVQVVRGQCGRTSLSTTGALRRDAAALAQTVADLDSAVRSTGKGRLVLLSADDESGPTTEALGASWEHVVDVTVRESQHVLERRPDGLDPLKVTVRLSPL